MAELLSGGPAARELTAALRARAEALRARGVEPTLALVRVGERGEDLAYERAACKRCEQCGVETWRVLLPADATQSELLGAILTLNGDRRVHGILLFRPLPDSLDEAAACAAIAPEKDVDGVTRASMASLYAGTAGGFAPCTAEACMELLRYYHVPLDGARATVIGRSLVVGRPAAQLLLRENATVSVAHTHTRDLPPLCRDADVLIVAAGEEGLVGAEHLRAGQTVIDVGIHASPDGTLRGDVRFDEARDIVRAVTPVPGGVGSLTTTILCRHVIEAADRR